MRYRHSLVRVLTALHLVAATGTMSEAQSTSLTALDSASAARVHFGSARVALRSGDRTGAQRMLERASHAWPTQPAYTSSLASIAARNNATSVVVAALSLLARLEAGSDVIADSALLALAARDPAVSAAHKRLLDALRPYAASRLFRQLSDSTLFPEGIAHHSRTGSLFVTSIRHRTLLEITSDGVERIVIPRTNRSPEAIMAVRVDADGEHVWATTTGLAMMEGYTAADSSLAALLRIRIADGVVVGRWKFGDGTRHIPGDLAIAPNGDVFVSDSHSPTLFRLRKGSTRFEPIAHQYFRSLQGIALTQNGEFLYVADYSHGLLRVRVADATVELVQHSDSISTLGLDGIVLHGSSLIAIQNGIAPARVVRFELDASGTAITAARTLDRQPDVADEPTNGVVIGNDFVYIANSQWEKYDADGKRIEKHALQPTRLLRLPLGPPTRPLW
jgi:sugar lactone lactonase YvrE